MDYRESVKDKSLAFAMRVVHAYQHLTGNQQEYVLSRQVLKSGTSIGANIAEAQYGFSRRDFLSKMYIALKECAETLYWLELLRAGDYLTQQEYDSLQNDCQELRRMLASITKTTRETPDKTT